jgi:hypothetical protein
MSHPDCGRITSVYHRRRAASLQHQEVPGQHDSDPGDEGYNQQPEKEHEQIRCERSYDTAHGGARDAAGHEQTHTHRREKEADPHAGHDDD